MHVLVSNTSVYPNTNVSFVISVWFSYAGTQYADREPRQLLLRLRGDQKRAHGRQSADKQVLRVQIAVGHPFHDEQVVREIPVG